MPTQTQALAAIKDRMDRTSCALCASVLAGFWCADLSLTRLYAGLSCSVPVLCVCLSECYVGRHRDAAIFLWPAVFLFCGGLPAWCLHAVLRTRKLNLWASAATKNVYLYRNLKIRWIWSEQHRDGQTHAHAHTGTDRHTDRQTDSTPLS